MPAPKGSNNAKAYQDAVKAKNIALVENELGRLKDARAIFNSITALSQAVAKSTGLTDVALRRNKQTRAAITKYISEQRGRSGYVSRAETELTKLRHQVTELELRLSNASQDNARLRAYHSKLKVAEDIKPQIVYSSPSNSDETKWEQNCQRTYHLVQAILSRAELMVNFENSTIEDVTGIGDDEIVAGANPAQPYVDWAKSRGLNDG